MRALARNKQAIYYALYQGKQDITEDSYYTGEQETVYSEPVLFKINVSPSKGNADLEIFGIEAQYSKVMVTADMSCPIDEYSRLWIGITPDQPYNYVVKRVARGLNSISYAIEEVSAS